ncbi:hypothetical protein I552_9713 [Mycobacterium xenopi 3993]|nr:hypothetical protein I552_9713 [Mycobacterium xenopi 3993]
MWRITPDVREVTVQLGDGKRGEARWRNTSGSSPPSLRRSTC